MPAWTAEDIERITQGCLYGNGSAVVHGCVLDSRKAKEGNMFFALKGNRADGHTFIGKAWEQGANVVIGEKDRINLWRSDWEKHIPSGKALVLVESVFDALNSCAVGWLDKIGSTVIGITGSNGKTTTKDMVAAVLSTRYKVYANQENHNNELGLPMTILNASDDTELLVLEMGMRGLGQIRDLCKIARPKVGVITNIGTTHLELLGTQECIAQAKWELIDALPEDGVAVLNGDDEWSIKMSNFHKVNARIYALEGKYARPHVQGSHLKPVGLMGTEFEVEWNGEKVKGTIPLPGEHNVLDALAALTVGTLFDVPLSEGFQGLASFKISQKRLELIKGIESSMLISDVYNANPVSMEASLRVLKERAKEHYTLAIFGDMYELGEQAISGHRQVGRVVNELQVNELITVGELGKEIVCGAIEAGYPKENAHSFSERKEAIEKAKEILKNHPHSWVLIKGSRGMKMEEITLGLVDCN